MAQGCIVERSEYFLVDIIQAAYSDLFRFASYSICYVLMTYKDIAPGLIHVHSLYGITYSIGKCPYLRYLLSFCRFRFKYRSDMNRLKEWQHVKIYLSELIFKTEHVRLSVISAGKVYPSLVHDARSE